MNRTLTNCFAYHKTEAGEMCEALKVMSCMKDGRVCPFFRLRNEVEAERSEKMQFESDEAVKDKSDGTIPEALAGIQELQAAYKRKEQDSRLTEQQKESIRKKIWHLEVAISSLKRLLPVPLRNMECIICGRRLTLKELTQGYMMYCPDCGQAIDKSITFDEADK